MKGYLQEHRSEHTLSSILHRRLFKQNAEHVNNVICFPLNTPWIPLTQQQLHERKNCASDFYLFISINEASVGQVSSCYHTVYQL